MGMPLFKYDKDIRNLALSISCPDSTSKNMEYDAAFRLVSNIEPTPEDYIPQSIKRIRNGRKPPQRRIESNDEKWFCEEWALSLFTSLRNVRDFVNNSPPNWKKSNKWYYIAKGPIHSSDGLCTKPDRITHFNLFEYASTDLRNKFNVIEST